MIINEEQIATLHPICSGAKLMSDNAQQFVYLPRLKITVGEIVKTVDGLLCPSKHSNYETRLFLSEPIVERPTIRGQPANWTVHSILTRTWHSWSWQGVSNDLPLVQMLLSHVGALR
jgi:hypothetical protein